VYRSAGFVTEGIRHAQYRSCDTYRDEVLMAWFPAGVIDHDIATEDGQ
jgi:hypothetical protein